MDEQNPPTASHLPGMTYTAYLNQTDIWVNPRYETVHLISDLTDGQRLAAARQLRSRATAFIVHVERERCEDDDFVRSVALTDRAPTTWLEGTALYGALYRDERPAPRPLVNPGARMAEVALKMSGQPNSQ